MKLLSTIIFLNIIVISSCYYDKEEQLYPNSVDTDCNKPLTYTNGIKTLIDANCASTGCHVTGGTSPDLSNFTSVTANVTKIIARAITQKNMPAPSGMSTCNITKLDNWIKAGMPQ